MTTEIVVVLACLAALGMTEIAVAFGRRERVVHSVGDLCDGRVFLLGSPIASALEEPRYSACSFVIQGVALTAFASAPET